MTTTPSSTRSDECVRCGYDLHTISNDHPCPECGLLAERSRRLTDELYDTRPQWLRRISRGVWMIFLAIPLPIVWPLVIYWLGIRFNYYSLMFGNNFTDVFLAGGCDLAAIMIAVGCWLIASPEGFAAIDDVDRRRRIFLRIAAFAAPLQAVVLFFAFQSSTRYTWGYERSFLGFGTMTMVLVASTLLIVPLPILLFLQLRSVAKRARSPHIAEHCLIAGIGTSLAILYLIAVMLFFDNPQAFGMGTKWMDRSNGPTSMIAVLFSLTILFLLWICYLLIRFAITFRTASKKRRQQWKLADRSEAIVGE